jgi:hypothetical protein
MKICAVGNERFNADGRTGKTKILRAFAFLGFETRIVQPVD